MLINSDLQQSNTKITQTEALQIGLESELSNILETKINSNIKIVNFVNEYLGTVNPQDPSLGLEFLPMLAQRG